MIGGLSQGTHSIRISDALSCDTSYNFTINNSAILALQLPNDTTIKKGSVVNIVAAINFNNPSNIVWDPTTFLSCTNCLNPQAQPDQTTTYMLTVTDQNGCTIKDAMTINVFVDEADIFVPTAFSPNGDQVNDFFKPLLIYYTSYKMEIFDRWGDLFFSTNEPETGWNGRVNEQPVLPGVYVYVIHYSGFDDKGMHHNKVKAVDFTLVR